MRLLQFNMARGRWSVLVISISLVLLLSIGFVSGDAGVEAEQESDGGAQDLALSKEIERLKEEIGSLESVVKRLKGQLTEKDAHIESVERELVSAKKSEDHGDLVKKLEKDLESTIQEAKGFESDLVDAREDAVKSGLEIEGLKKRARVAEKSFSDLQIKYEKKSKDLEEQRARTKKAEGIVKVAEAAMKQAELEAKAKAQELLRVYEQWLPPWAASRAAELQTSASKKWSTHGQPRVDAIYVKVGRHARRGLDWANPHLVRVKSQVGSAVLERWEIVSNTLHPHVEKLRFKISKGFQIIKDVYFMKVYNFIAFYYDVLYVKIQPYVALIQEHTRPYVDQIYNIAKPYLDQIHAFFNPHLKRFSPYYSNVAKSAAKYHQNLQETVKGTLSRNEIAAKLLSYELVWVLASGLLALPIFTAFLLLSTAFGGTKKRIPKRAGGTSSGKPRRAKKVDK